MTRPMAMDTLQRLAATIRERRSQTADRSYTRQLLDGGPERCAKKFGEEAVETVIAAIHQDDKALRAEAADLLYHLLVVLEVRGIALDDVLEVLEDRTSQSGHQEKASRQSR
ncbi:MAG: phosphoribosyl-ATP diphosphatase [Hyphomicrobiaceae bacterium]